MKSTTTKTPTGKLVHEEYGDGYEFWYDYDSNNNCIHWRNSNGYEAWSTYDTNNNEIHFRNSNGYEAWYDENGNRISKPKTNMITTKEQLFQDIKNTKTAIESNKNALQNLENHLNEIEGQLKNLRVKPEEALEGDTLEDGFVVVHRCKNMLLLAAPVDTVRWLNWYDRRVVLDELPSDCFIPTMKHLILAKNLLQKTGGVHMSSNELPNEYNTMAFDSKGNLAITVHKKEDRSTVRAFRCLVI